VTVVAERKIIHDRLLQLSICDRRDDRYAPARNGDLFRGHESAPSLRHGAIDSDILPDVIDVAD
jgi:hypothetical protein